VDAALHQLYRRHVRAAVGMAVRLIGAAVLIAALESRLPAIREWSPFVTVVAAALVIWPFYTSTGRIVAWRIALGSTYLKEHRWHDAERTLGVLLHRRWQPFDFQGEGIYGLATALREQGRTDESIQALQELVRTRRGVWREKAEEDLRETTDPGSPNRMADS